VGGFTRAAVRTLRPSAAEALNGGVRVGLHHMRQTWPTRFGRRGNRAGGGEADGALLILPAVHKREEIHADHGGASSPKPYRGGKKYEGVVRRLTGGKLRIEVASDLPFEGLLVHMAGQAKNGFCVVDLFGSEEAVSRFNEAMASIPGEVGIEEPPDFFPVHTFMSTAPIVG
jgi:hypothetical protein